MKRLAFLLIFIFRASTTYNQNYPNIVIYNFNAILIHGVKIKTNLLFSSINHMLLTKIEDYDYGKSAVLDLSPV